ncbi:MAG: cytidylate kinase family protein [Chloroflexi bacterium]|nr:cytidylate kinase family protein [Chloroflexota bacterium]
MPIITISRGTFSGGRDIAECLAERLGYPCVSREVIVEAAQEYGVPVNELTEAISRPPSFWQQLTGERASYVDYFRAALCERARGTELVYHGYAGHLLLRGISHVIRVRVIADMEYRVGAAMARMGLGRKEAIAYIKKVDEDRVRWTRFLYGVDWHDASLYDVVINLERVSVQGACDILVHMAGLPEFQATPESLRAAADLALGCHVRAVLARDPRTRGADVKVSASGGVVTITGSTRLEEVVEAIPLVAGQVGGISEIRCEVSLG